MDYLDQSQCPGNELIAAYQRAAVSVAVAYRLAAHFASCDACRRIAEETVEGMSIGELLRETRVENWKELRGRMPNVPPAGPSD